MCIASTAGRRGPNWRCAKQHMLNCNCVYGVYCVLLCGIYSRATGPRMECGTTHTQLQLCVRCVLCTAVWHLQQGDGAPNGVRNNTYSTATVWHLQQGDGPRMECHTQLRNRSSATLLCVIHSTGVTLPLRDSAIDTSCTATSRGPCEQTEHQ